MTTNLNQIKEITKLLARTITVSQCRSYAVSVSHPFVDSYIWVSKFKNPAEGITKDIDLRVEATYKAWLKEFEHFIDSAKTVLDIYMYWRTPYKLLFVKLCKNALSEKDLAEYMADAWVTEENPNMDVNVSTHEALSIFKSCKKEYLMTKEDYKHYQSLPDQVTLWRGVGVGRTKYGLSWTDNKDKAEWFMNRWNSEGKHGTLLEVTVDKKYIVAYFNTRSEQEILLDVFACKNKIKTVKLLEKK